MARNNVRPDERLECHRVGLTLSMEGLAFCYLVKNLCDQSARSHFQLVTSINILYIHKFPFSTYVRHTGQQKIFIPDHDHVRHSEKDTKTFWQKDKFHLWKQIKITLQKYRQTGRQTDVQTDKGTDGLSHPRLLIVENHQVSPVFVAPISRLVPGQKLPAEVITV